MLLPCLYIIDYLGAFCHVLKLCHFVSFCIGFDCFEGVGVWV